MFERKLFCFIVIISMEVLSSYCQLQLWDEKITPKCTADGQEFCKSCSVAASCIMVGGELREFNSTCTSGAVCNSATNACDGNTTTVPACSCVTSSGITYQADPYNDHWYITCIDGSPFYIDCGVLYFDGINTCIDTLPNPATCDEPGVFPDEIDTTCAGYYICASNGSEPFFDSCPPDSGGAQYFDPTTNLCAPFPDPFACNVTGAFGDPFDCKRYYICTSNVLNNTGCCPTGEVYSPEVANCVADDGSCVTRQCQVGQVYCS